MKLKLTDSDREYAKNCASVARIKEHTESAAFWAARYGFWVARSEECPDQNYSKELNRCEQATMRNGWIIYTMTEKLRPAR